MNERPVGTSVGKSEIDRMGFGVEEERSMVFGSFGNERSTSVGSGDQRWDYQRCNLQKRWRDNLEKRMKGYSDLLTAAKAKSVACIVNRLKIRDQGWSWS